MSTFKALYDKLKRMDVDKIIDNALDNTMDDLEEINRERMNDGVRADGTTMPMYSYISQVVYGYPNTPIKLKATGSFQEKLFSKREGDIIHTFSADYKAEMLGRRYGPVFGTSGDYKRQYQAEHLVPYVHKAITSATGLKFKK